MGTIIWLIITTVIGYAVGHLFYPENMILCTVLGFVFGLILRFIPSLADSGLDLID